MDTASEVASACLASRVRKLNRLVTNLYDEALRPFGLRIGQLSILAAAAPEESTRPAQLCRKLGMDPSTLSRNLQVLRKRGWIEFLEDSDDARAQPFRVTRAGRDLIDRAYPAWSFAQQEAERLLEKESSAALRPTLARDPS